MAARLAVAPAGAGKEYGVPMKNIWLWIIGIGIIFTIGLLLLLGLGFLRIQSMPMNWINGGSNVWRDGNWHHDGVRWGVPMMGLFGGLLMIIFTLGFLGLTVVGVVLLVRALQSPQRNGGSLLVGEHCKQCGKKVSPEWQVCPYCGESLKGD
jgi:hypothetical protein